MDISFGLRKWYEEVAHNPPCCTCYNIFVRSLNNSNTKIGLVDSLHNNGLCNHVVIDSGIVINEQSSYWQNSALLVYECQPEYMSCSQGSQIKFMPVKLIKNDTSYFGWIRMQNSNKFFDMAINLNPNQSIVTGQKDTLPKSINGIISYANTSNTPLNDITVDLKNNNGVVVASTITNSTGGYSFSNVANGDYTLEVATNKPWDGVTAGDVLLYKKHIANIIPLTGIYYASGDVNASGSLTATDVLMIKKRIIAVTNSFTVGDWLFNNGTINVNGLNVNYNFKGLVYGDANGSYIPVEQKMIFPLKTIK